MDVRTPQEAADYLKMPVETLAYWRRMGTGPEYFMSGKHARYCVSDLDEWIRQGKAEQTEKTRQRVRTVSAK